MPKSKDPVTREYTINLHKRLTGINFKKRAPRAVKEVRTFARKMMGTSDVRVDVKLNKEIWSRGIRNVPNKMRIQISRKYALPLAGAAAPPAGQPRRRCSCAPSAAAATALHRHADCSVLCTNRQFERLFCQGWSGRITKQGSEAVRSTW
jgi:ribosomal protein L31E